MSQGYDVGLIARESLNSSWQPCLEQVVKATGATLAGLLLSFQNVPELDKVVWYGREEMPTSWAAVARWILSRTEPVCWRGVTDAREILGGNFDGNLLPLIGISVKGSVFQGALVIASLRSVKGDFSGWLLTLELLGKLAGTLLENVYLQRELNQKEEQMRYLIKNTFDAQEAERERIGLDVHDGVTQTLASVFQYLQTLETISPDGTTTKQLLLRAGALTKQAIQESREVINSLQPATLRDLGLVVTIGQEIRQLEQEMGWEVDFQTNTSQLPKDMETGLYRIIREAVTNARKHAKTNRLQVRIISTNDRVNVEVKDWGIGFNYSPNLLTKGRGVGLLSLRKRAELLRGTCEIESKPGQGTTIRVEVPLVA